MITVPQARPHVPLATHGGNHGGGDRVILAVPTLIQEFTHANQVPSFCGSSSELASPEVSVTLTKKMLRFLPAWTSSLTA